MAEAAKKKIKLNFGLSKEKIAAMAGDTLTSGGMPVPKQTTSAPNSELSPATPPRRSKLSDAFNAAANAFRPAAPAARAPRGPSL